MAGSLLIEQFRVDLSEIEMIQRVRAGEHLTLVEQHRVLNQMLDVAEIQLTRRMGVVKITEAEFAAWLGVTASGLSRWRSKQKKFTTPNKKPDLPDVVNCVTLSRVFGPIIFDLRGLPRLHEPASELESAILYDLSLLGPEGMAAAAKFIKELANGRPKGNGGMAGVRRKKTNGGGDEVRGIDAGE